MVGRPIRRRVLAAGAAATLAVGLMWAGNTATATAQEPCNYYEDAGKAYFNNCTDEGWIVRVVTVPGQDNYRFCAMPGVHELGKASQVQRAYYDPFEPLPCG